MLLRLNPPIGSDLPSIALLGGDLTPARRSIRGTTNTSVSAIQPTKELPERRRTYMNNILLTQNIKVLNALLFIEIIPLSSSSACRGRCESDRAVLFIYI